MESILEILVNYPGIEGALIVGKDGLVIAKYWNNDSDADLFGGTVAELFTTAENMADERLHVTPVTGMVLQGPSGLVVLEIINEVTMLAVKAQAGANLGLVRWQTRDATEKLKEIL